MSSSTYTERQKKQNRILLIVAKKDIKSLDFYPISAIYAVFLYKYGKICHDKMMRIKNLNDFSFLPMP